MDRAVFLDKDGTLVQNVPHNIDPGRLTFSPGMIDALRVVQRRGYRIVVVSNQPGVAQGLFSEDDLRILRQALRDRMAEQGVRLDGFYYCPHHPTGRVQKYRAICHCRKPLPGLLHRAALDLNLRLRHSWMVGDILDDIEAGKRAGCRSILYSVGNETEWVLSPLRVPDFVIEDSDGLERLIRRAETGMAALNSEVQLPENVKARR